MTIDVGERLLHNPVEGRHIFTCDRLYAAITADCDYWNDFPDRQSLSSTPTCRLSHSPSYLRDLWVGRLFPHYQWAWITRLVNHRNLHDPSISRKTRSFARPLRNFYHDHSIPSVALVSISSIESTEQQICRI